MLITSLIRMCVDTLRVCFLCCADEGAFALRQERYQRDQQRLQAEWRRAEEGAGEGPRGSEVSMLLI